MTTADRLKAALDSIILRVTGRYEYAIPYAYTVVAQNADGTLELNPDRTDLVPGLSGVPIRYSHPGESVLVPSGVRCFVMFANADPAKPFVLGFEAGSITQIKLGNATDFVALSTLVLTQLQAIQLWATTHVHPGVTAGGAVTGPTGTPLAPPGSVAATKVMAE